MSQLQHSLLNRDAQSEYQQKHKLFKHNPNDGGLAAGYTSSNLPKQQPGISEMPGWTWLRLFIPLDVALLASFGTSSANGTVVFPSLCFSEDFKAVAHL